MALVHILDGAKSLLAAAATVAICGGPSWFTHVAIREGAAPFWAYGFAAALAGVGLIMTLAFLRKAAGGIAPSRDRARR